MRTFDNSEVLNTLMKYSFAMKVYTQKWTQDTLKLKAPMFLSREYIIYIISLAFNKRYRLNSIEA